MKLTKLERMNLANQFKILERLLPENADYYSKQIEVLESGYEFLYQEMFQNIADGDDVMTDVECKEVWSTMDMFDGINRSIDKMDGSRFEEAHSKFAGYDGNNEGKFMAFAEFTVRRERRFTYLPLLRDDYFNSHAPVRGMYRRMLAVWNKVPQAHRYNMSEEQLNDVLDAAVHPDYRTKES